MFRDSSASGGPVPGQAHPLGGDLKEAAKPARRRQIVGYLQEGFRISERRACRLLVFSRTSHRYQSVKTDDPVLRRRIRELAASRPRFGYRRIGVLLRREGWPVNTKRVYRIYREEGLEVRIRRRRKRASHGRLVTPAPERPGERWSMDFVTDRLDIAPVSRADRRR